MRSIAVASAAALFLWSCTERTPPAGAPAARAPASKQLTLQGAGATFPYPLYSKWISDYQQVDPSVRINYQSIGSGGGIRQVTERTVDFGATDAPMTDAELEKAPGRLVHVPATLGAVVVAYHLPGAGALVLSSDVLAGIFLGEVTRWDDARLAALNPGVTLPKEAITVVYRSDGSGTTAVFTDYLASTSPTWKERVGAGKAVRFPVGLGAKGNEGVSGQLKTTPYTLGYVELAYAKQTGLSHARLLNRAGKAVEASVEAVTAAAAGAAANMPDDLRVSLVNAAGEAAYPLASFSYLLVYEDAPDTPRGQALARFLWWAVHEGQSRGPALHYAPLPADVVAKVEARLRALKGGGRALLPGT